MENQMNDTKTLPELPKTIYLACDLYDADQMRAYATEAVKQALAQSHPTTTQPTGSLNLPDLSTVITWMENGCSDIEAIKELRLYQKQIDAAKQAHALP
jgi:hypothetical protein